MEDTVPTIKFDKIFAQHILNKKTIQVLRTTNQNIVVIS